MSFYALAVGPLIGDPQPRAGGKGPFTTATIRANGDVAILVSIIAFGDEAGRLLEFAKGDALAVSGRARLTSWTGRDGTEKHGISLIVEQIAAAKPCPRSKARPGGSMASPRPRSRPSARRSAPGAASRGAELPADRVDDLYAEGSTP